MKKKVPYVSLVIPVYNEEESLSLLHENITHALETQDFSYEVIYVDDGSGDGSFRVLQRLAESDARVCVVRLARNFGQTAALAAGVAQSRAERLVFLDGDLQNDPRDIPRLLAKLEEGYDVVSGWRRERQDAGLSRNLPSWLANRLIRKVTGLELHDSGCTLKAYRREIFDHVQLYGEMHRLIPAYAALAGASIAEIEVTHHARQFGRSKYGLSRTLRVILDLLSLKFRSSYATKPHYAFGIPGLGALLLGLLCCVLPLGRKVVRPTMRAGRTSFAPLALSCTGFGLGSLMLGLLAEMLMRTYHESQDRPTYVLRSVTRPAQEKEEITAARLLAVGE